MTREVEPQSERYAMSPHWHDDDEAQEDRRYHDEQFGLNREPPTDHDPGFREHEVDPYPHA